MKELNQKSICSKRIVYNDFEVAIASTVEETKQVISAGYDYVTEKCGVMLFRRPKRFSNM